MTNKENYMRLVRGEVPESIPHFNFMSVVGPSVLRKDRNPDGSGFDCFGIEYVYTPEAGGGSLPKPDKFMFTDISKWREYVKIPDLSGVDWESMSKADLSRIDREAQPVVGGYVTGFFQTLIGFMGFTEGLVAIAEDPEEVKAFLEAITDFYLEVGKKMIDYYKPDLMWMADDVCASQSPFMSPKSFKEVFKPYWKKYVDFFKEAGLATELHCCGNAMPLADDFVDLGFALWDPMQTTNPIPELKKKYGKKLAYVGGFEMAGISSVTADMPEEEVRQKVRDIIDSYAFGGGYAFFGPQMPQDYKDIPIGDIQRNRMISRDEMAKYAPGYYEGGKHQ